MTDAERLLWSKVRLKQLNSLQFYRQKIVGNYITDFFVIRLNLLSKSMEASIIRKKVKNRMQKETHT